MVKRHRSQTQQGTPYEVGHMGWEFMWKTGAAEEDVVEKRDCQK